MFVREKGRRSGALLIVLALALLLVSPVFAAETAVTMQLTRTTGTVSILNARGRDVTVREKMRLYDGYILKTGAASYAWIALDDSKLVRIDAASEVEVRKDGKNLELFINLGSVFFNVSKPLEEDESLNICTSNLALGVRGTTGWVSMRYGVSTAALLEGQALCTALGSSVQVEAGMLYSVSDSGTAVSEKIDRNRVPGFVLTEVVANPALCAEILKASGVDLTTMNSGEAAARQSADEARTARDLLEIRKAEARQRRPRGGSGSGRVPEQIVHPNEPEAPEEIVVTVGDFVVSGGLEGVDFRFEDPVLTILSAKPLTIRNRDEKPVTDNRIEVSADAPGASITLAGVHIDTNESGGSDIKYTAGDNNTSDNSTGETEGTAAFLIPDNYENDVTVYLADGSKNELKSSGSYAGLQKNGDSSGLLTIDGSGSLTASGGAGSVSNGENHDGSIGTRGGSGIGGASGEIGMNITIKSGTVTALGGPFAAGIGGGDAAGTNITIRGGTVTAAGGKDGAGIGGGFLGIGADITISGGSVRATGGGGSAGIGGGVAEGTNITITGGTVTATGGGQAAGIGGGHGDGTNITISGGTVTATGGTGGYGAGAGIGGGLSGSGTDITISGGTVTAIGGNCDSGAGAGIGGGNGKDGTNITISGGSITATGGSSDSGDGAGIGGGNHGTGSNITITGGYVTADGSKYGAGIGNGAGSSSERMGEVNVKVDGNAFVCIKTGYAVPVSPEITDPGLCVTQGIVFYPAMTYVGMRGRVVGEITLSSYMKIPEDCTTLTIWKDAVLTVPDFSILDNIEITGEGIIKNSSGDVFDYDGAETAIALIVEEQEIPAVPELPAELEEVPAEPDFSAEPEVTPTEPSSPAKPEETPTEPDTSAEPEAAPTEPDSSAEPVVTPTEPDSSAEPVITPSEPGSSAEPEVTPTEPDSSAEPAVTPSESGSSAEPEVTPTEPDSSAEPAVTPTEPGSPAEPAVTPSEPGSSAEPAVTPSEPGSPAEPEAAPTEPAAPSEPEGSGGDTPSET